MWTASVSSSGYGQFSISGRHFYAHRLGYEISKGPIPDGLVIDHLCRTPLCVNANHHEPVTNGENVRRGFAPTHVASRANRCLRDHAFTPENTIIKPGGFRECRTCANAGAMSRWAARYVPVPRTKRSDCAPCGTHGGYRRHLRQKELVCEPCRDAEREHHRVRDAKRVPQPRKVNINQPSCGTVGGYERHHRLKEPVCDSCVTAHRAKQAEYRAARREARSKVIA